MKALRLTVLALGVLAVFVAPNPLPADQYRTWQEVVFTWAGIVALVLAVADSWIFALLGAWICGLWIVHRTPDAFAFMVFLIGGLGLYTLAKRTTSKTIIQGIGVIMTTGIGLQAAGLFDPMMTLAVPSYHREVYNVMRPLTGFTASTGDAGAVLAMCAPYFTAGSSLLLLPLVLWALAATKATSAIIAGLIATGVAFSPRVRAFLRGVRAEYGTGTVCGVLVIAGSFSTLVINHLDPLWGLITDQRWRVWRHGLERVTLAGHGLGSWKRLFPLVEHNGALDQWGQAHFDLLQFAFEAGAVGAVLAALFLAESAACAAKTGRRAALGAVAALCVAQVGHFPLHLGTAGAVAALVLADARRQQ